jgi:outer membrane protein assembly factor BamD (BamD/ComL family)
MRNAARAGTHTFILLLATVGGATGGCSSHNKAAPAASRRQELAAGYAAFDQRHYDEAIGAAERVLKEDSVGPGSAEALYLEGRVHEQKAQEGGGTSQAREHLRTARALYQRALASKPPQPLEAYLRAGLANTSYFLEDYPTAAREWANAYPHINDPDAKAWVLYRAGLSEQRQGHFAQADRQFAEVQQLFAGSEQAKRAAAHQGAAGFYVQVGTFATGANADHTAGMLKAQGYSPVKATDPSGRQTIAVGPVTTYQQAKSLHDRLAAQYPGAMIVP